MRSTGDFTHFQHPIIYKGKQSHKGPFSPLSELVICPGWQMTVTPVIEQVDERGAVVDFYISAPQWGKSLFECSAGMGSEKDTERTPYSPACYNGLNLSRDLETTEW